MKKKNDSSARMTGTKIGVRRGRCEALRDGKPVSQAVYCDYILRGDWKERNADFVRSGVKVFHLTEPHGAIGNGHDFFDNAFWVDDGVYPEDDFVYEYSLDRQAKDILALAPDALFYIKFNLSPPIRWTQKYSGEMQTDEDGKTYREPSWCSEKYLAGLVMYIRRLVGFCEGREWGSRILGYMALPYGEGLSQICCAGKMFDCSETSEREFRFWLAKRYGTVKTLRAAWANPDVDFNSARVPRDREWIARKANGSATIGGVSLDASSHGSNCGKAAAGFFHWIEPSNVAVENDYCRFMRDVFIKWIQTVAGVVKGSARALGRERVMLLDITKQPMLGWPIQSNFDGVGDAISFPNMLLLSGSWGVESLLDDPNLDGLWTPADYTARSLGFAFECEGLSDSLVIRGKTMMLENDSRCYVGSGIRDQGAFRTPIEVDAGLTRNAAVSVSRGFESYWCNVGSSYFHDPGIQKTVKKLTRLHDRLLDWPHRETRDAVAMVIDDESCLYEDMTSGYQSLAVIWQRARGLAHCGVPYRIFLLSDLAKAGMPDYKTWLFPNLFRVDEDVIKLLRAKALRNGNVAIFGPATGITDGRVIGASAASELLGVPMELHPRTTVRHVVVHHSGHPITGELSANMVFGDSMAYGPTLTPCDRAIENTAGAAVLGHANLCWFINRAGLFVKEFGKGAACKGAGGGRGRDDYAVVWSAAMPIPAELIRACARHAGSNIWCEENDVIYASDSVAAIHSMKKGRRVISLPRPCVVADAVTGKAVARGRIRKISLDIASPQTRVFTLA